MHPFINIGIRAARTAGQIIVRALEQLDQVQVEEKSQNDFVTEIDRQAENAILHIIQKNYPDHAILAEESGSIGSRNSDTIWIIDPLDGTNNFMHGFPHFSVSIAVKHKNVLEHAIIYDPIRNDLFTASRGDGAKCNDRRIRVSQRTQLKGTLLGTGFPYRQQDIIDDYLSGFKALFMQSGTIRGAGSAALDLAYVAAGYLDGFWEFGLKPWDIAAGALLIKEAGGLIGDMKGGEQYLESGDVVAANPKLFKLLLKTLATSKIPSGEPT